LSVSGAFAGMSPKHKPKIVKEYKVQCGQIEDQPIIEARGCFPLL
jgi:hypothetical protein